VRIYAEDWGEATDVGVVAVVDGQDAGACWMRLVTGGRGFDNAGRNFPTLAGRIFPHPWEFWAFSPSLKTGTPF